MKDLDFMKQSLISNKGIFDNINIFENTIESFTKALEKNLIINLKVRLTKDKVLVVYEDNNLGRLMNLKDKIGTTTYEELLYLNPYHIPTLKEVLELINGKVPVIINPKGLEHKYFLHKELVSILDNYQGKFAILSSSVLIIRWYNKNKPGYIVGEILSKCSKLNKFVFLDFFINFIITTDFKSMDVEYYNIIKIKKISENYLVLSYIADTKEKYDIYKNVAANLFIDKLFED